MALNDIINGFFEAGAAMLCLGHIRIIKKDKAVRGLYVPAVLFYCLWGYWNIFFYSNLDQWFSWVAGIVLAVLNTYWAYLLWKYDKK